MTPNQIKKMNEFIQNRMSGHNGDMSELIKFFMKESYQAAMKEAEVLVEALETYCEWHHAPKLEELIKKFKGE